MCPWITYEAPFLIWNRFVGVFKCYIINYNYLMAPLLIYDELSCFIPFSVLTRRLRNFEETCSHRRVSLETFDKSKVDPIFQENRGAQWKTRAASFGL